MIVSMELTNSLKYLAEMHGGAGPFADKVGIKRNTFYTYVSGDREPRASDILSIADRSEVSLDWLLRGVGVGPSASIEAKLSGESISIPRFEVQAAAGDGSEVLSQEVADYFIVSKDWVSRYITNGAKLGMIEARGDSMEPTIRDGDGLIINFNFSKMDLNQGGVFIISTSDGVKVKRLQVMIDGGIRISSDNPNYAPETIDREFADEHLHVQAKVIFSIGHLRLR